ncbi:uncharacterized protein PGTG_19042 [Puccinia graminis f. sp. tritici CRL 75-36-700-3]|uniref:C2H2-type domain-containing protein n=1 Tax=Puccinia graminis f. sp. tritici (strain CRL 75-36-700-3 / race SCCL) TaxID=418459 RepID=E3L8N8_PUCGT|nr:uncharacterized protein PGTG_19042 [Puccinia graminis f. sp. tritici CRL 75-36-700-3]EFP92924.1 hypothetical protein PGTG_19042 [Puccinia graminis f. sp. tritici CRL 75-36-700-3]
MAFCAPCNRSFNAYHSYLQHLNNSPQHRHDPNTLPYRPPAAGLHCVACGRVFYTRVEFVRHVYGCTRQIMDYECACGRQFARESSLVSHFERLTCPSWVDLRFVDNYFSGLCDPEGRFVHRERISQDPPMPNFIRDRRGSYWCRLCHLRFRTPHELMCHVWSPPHKNWGLRAYQCPSDRCQRMEFFCLSDLMAHLETGQCEEHLGRELSTMVIGLVDVVGYL